MTVAIGLVCSDGALVASDSMASDQLTAHDVQKVFKLDCCPMVWTASGSVYVIEEVRTALAGIDQATAQGTAPVAFGEPNLPALRTRLTNTIVPAMRKCYQGALASTPFEPGSTAGSFATTFLTCGYANAIPWLLEFAQDGQVNWHTEFGFYAIGSGGPFARVAHGLMAHYLKEPLSLEQSMLVAYRAIETTCEVSHSYVRLPVQIAVVDSSGPRILEDAELNGIRDSVNRWKTLEYETLINLAGARAAPVGDLPSLDEDAGENESSE